MFGMGGMFNDPFFSMQEMHRQHMQRMNEMMVNPFGNLAPMMVPAPMAITDGQRRDRDYQRRGERQLARRQDPFMLMDPFAHSNHMLQMMNQMQGGMHGNLHGGMHGNNMHGMTTDPNGQFYSSSTFMSYSNTGDGAAPHVYQASSSTHQGPGGVKETRKAVRDSRAGVEKMAIGRHINDRAHIVSKSRNVHTRDMEENQDFINLDEEEADEFNHEWKEKAQRYGGGQRHGGRQLEGGNPPQHRPALQYNPGEN